VLASVGAALAVGTCLALLVDGLTVNARIHTPELVLIGLGSIVALGATLAATLRALRASWRSAPAVEQIGARAARALGVGLLAFGAIELAARTWAVLALRHPGAWDPLWAATRVLLALGVALIVTALGRRRA
jgi:cytochrome bd-type quinol oxidase subunit 2